MKKYAALCFLIFALGINSFGQNKTATKESNTTEETLKVSVCRLLKEPSAYNKKLIEVTAFVSHGFEDFGLFDPTCDVKFQNIWLEYGGKVKSGTMYCCGVSADRERTKPLIVENIPILLDDNETFRKFDKLIQRAPDSIVHATIAGRFFAGEKLEYSKSEAWGGYGHMGCCTLLAIQKVLSVDSQDNTDLDYRASAEQPNLNKYGGYQILDLDDSGIKVQTDAELNQTDWRFNSPQKTAADALARILKIDESAITKGITQTGQAQGRFIYYWKDKTKGEYMVVVSRPYWLSFYAKDPKRVAWLAIAAYKMTK